MSRQKTLNAKTRRSGERWAAAPSRLAAASLFLLIASVLLFAAGWLIPAFMSPGKLSKAKFEHGQQLRSEVLRLTHTAKSHGKGSEDEAKASQQLNTAMQALKDHIREVDGLKTRGVWTSRILIGLGMACASIGLLFRNLPSD